MEIDVFGIPGPIFFDTKTFYDERGLFREIFNTSRYQEWLPIGIEWKQINHSHSLWNTVRGLHFRDGEEKLITVVTGSIIDVVVDIRKDSGTFCKWMSIQLNAGQQFFIPNGFAHGFETTSPTGADVVYMTTQTYDSTKSGGIAWNDPDIGIKWKAEFPILSEQDKNNKTLKEYLNG